MAHDLARRLGIDVPILQAPMAGAQDADLAVAVCEAGGLGALPCAMLSSDGIRAQVESLRARSARPFNLNFFCHAPPVPDAVREAAWLRTLAPHFAALGIDPDSIEFAAGRIPFDEAGAALVEALRPPVVSFHFGLPNEALLARVRATGASVLSSATTVAEARDLEARGVDAVIAQGLEAGGHRGHYLRDDLAGQLGTFALLPQIVAAVRVPVIAAGGIADAACVAAARALGASGVQVGTSFLRCPEAKTSALHRAALASPEAADTALTNLFTGRPARGIVNRFMREVGALRDDAPRFPRASAAAVPLRAAAEARGSSDYTPLWAGQNTSGCRADSASQVVADLAAGWRAHA